jgi:hypothetical protein
MLQSNGAPHLTFIDESSQLSFVWDGKSPVIEVTGGAEPDTIPIHGRVGINNATIQRWMDWFELVCRNYIRIKIGENGDKNDLE